MGSWKSSEKGYLMVEPQLSIRGEPLMSLDEIMLQTMVPKWMGPMKEWDAYFELAQSTGYNMIHFIPVQKRGISNSPYSIVDHSLFSEDLFENPLCTQDEKYQQLIHMVKRMETHYGLLSMIDVVWNHTASNSVWLHEHPEAAYNLKECSYLKAAYELEKGIMEFSQHIVTYGLSPDITSEEDLERIMQVLEKECLPRYRLWEFSVIEVNETVKSLGQYLAVDHDVKEEPQEVMKESLSLSSLLTAYALYKEKDNGRFCHRIHVEKAARCLGYDGKAFDPDYIVQTCSAFKTALDDLNWDRYQHYNDTFRDMVNNIRNTVKYERLEAKLKPTRIDAK
jgi:glycogen debranching enzyme